MIHLADGLQLPDSAVTNAYALLGMKGSGKSNAAVVMAEAVFDAGIPWCAIDPKGDWWGIRSGARAGASGGLPVVIFGGLHADIPIDQQAGATIAELIVGQHLTCLIDTSEFSKGESIRFLTAFFDRLYRLKNRSTFPMHVFLEECDDYVPQKVYGEIAGLVRTVEMVVKRGRQRGLGITLASQRSASVNKDVLTQTDTLVALRTTSPQDRKAVLEWLNYHAGAKEIVDELPLLRDGEAWVSSPAQLRILKKVRFHRRRTFDSGATPELGEKVKPATLADIDIAAVSAALATQIEKAKADDPKHLRAELATARARISHLEQHPVIPDTVEVKVERPVPFVPPEVKAALRAMLGAMDAAREQLMVQRDRYVAALALAEEEAAPPITRERAEPRAPARAPERAVAPGPDPDPRRGAPVDGVKLGRGEVKILTALAQAADGTLTKRQAAVLAGYRVTGGHFGNMLGALRTAGFLARDTDPLRITDAGRAYLGPVDAAPSGPELLDWWLARSDVKGFGDGAKKILLALVNTYPAAMGKAELAEKTGYDPGGGHFGNMLGRLRTLGLVTKTGDPRLTDEFGDAIR